MRRFLHYFFLTVGVLSIAVGAVGTLARCAGGPIGPVPGGALSGRFGDAFELARFAEADTIALQVNPAAPRSVTTWVIALDDALYVPASFADRKVWPQIALADPRVVIRLGDALHYLRARRVEDPVLIRRLHAALATKYGVGGTDPGQTDGSDDGLWFFRLDPPDA